MLQNEIDTILSKAYSKEFSLALLKNFEGIITGYKAKNLQKINEHSSEFIKIIVGTLWQKQSSEEFALLNGQSLLSELWQSEDTTQNAFKSNVLSSLIFMHNLSSDDSIQKRGEQSKTSAHIFMLTNCCKFILAQLIIENSDARFNSIDELITSLLEKDIVLIWNTGKTMRALNNKMHCKEKVLCLLYMKNFQSTSELLASTEYANETVFRMYLKELHEQKMIEYINDKCNISPLGKSEAEKLFSKY